MKERARTRFPLSHRTFFRQCGIVTSVCVWRRNHVIRRIQSIGQTPNGRHYGHFCCVKVEAWLWGARFFNFPEDLIVNLELVVFLKKGETWLGPIKSQVVSSGTICAFCWAPTHVPGFWRRSLSTNKLWKGVGWWATSRIRSA